MKNRVEEALNDHVEFYGWIFVAHDDNPVQFTVGRDICLDPPQQGDPLNCLIYSDAELDGKALADGLELWPIFWIASNKSGSRRLLSTHA